MRPKLELLPGQVYETVGKGDLKPIICIVEDDTAVRESLRLLLELRGYGIEEFETGAELLARGRFGDVFCIIFDLNLPGESGLQILARLRAQGLETPALLVTGRADSAVRREAQRLAVLSLFEKPLPARALIAAIEGISAVALASSQ